MEFKPLTALLFLLLQLQAWAAAVPGTVAARATCPALCNPTAGLNQCDVSTSCIWLTGAAGVPSLPLGLKYSCACAAGFRPANPADGIRYSQTLFTSWVFVAPNTPCNTPCTVGGGATPCLEVAVHDECF